MIPQNQRWTSMERGDCLAACLASILEIEIDSMPDFYEGTGGSTPRVWDAVIKWLEARGYAILQVPKKVWISFMFLPGVYAIAGVKSQKLDCEHAIVVCWRTLKEGSVKLDIVHDPNPLNKRKYEPRDILDFTFLIPLDYH